jgi:hypothetical protein
MWEYSEWGKVASSGPEGQNFIADDPTRLMPTRSERKLDFTSQLSAVLDYPVDLDLESLEENVSQRRLTAVAQEGTYPHCHFGGASGFLLFFVIDIVPDAGSSRSHWHRIGCPLIRRQTNGVHYVDNVHWCHRRALDIISHVQAIVSTCKPGLQGGITNRGRTSPEGN